MKSGHGAPPEERGTKPGCKALQEATGFGRSPQRDDPSCTRGMTQNFVHKEDLGL
jgi:hypothetical protein